MYLRIFLSYGRLRTAAGTVVRTDGLLVALVVKTPATKAADMCLIPASTVDLVSSSSHTTDFKVGTVVTTLPGL